LTKPAFWIGAAAIAAYLSFATFEEPDRPYLQPEQDRKPAPDFILKDSGGAATKLSDYRGRVVLLNFWASWCGPCREEIPWFTEFERQFKDRGFTVLGVAFDERGWTTVKPYMKWSNIDYPVSLGGADLMTLYGGVDALPVTFMIDREGRIARMHIGAAGKSTYRKEILDLLSAQSSVVSYQLSVISGQFTAFAQSAVVLTVAPSTPVQAKIGATVDAKLPLQLRPGYHVQSNTPTDKYLIPLKLTWNPGPLQPAAVVYPKPLMEKYSFSPQPQSVFSGNFELTTKFKVPASAIAGPTAITGKLRYQACNDTMCLPPRNMDVSLQVDIVR
jgi:thiol-disulfide isomerase/thioredoxin